jgi:aspartyl-tRNA(Asn)/glutamyl-tRNA(Gln) amidotransferase subunit C
VVTINEDLTRKVADLARLALTNEEVTLYTTQIEKTLSYVDSLRAVVTEGVEPQYHPFSIDTPLREDVVHEFQKTTDGKPKVLEHAPEVLYDGFKVPPIL